MSIDPRYPIGKFEARPYSDEQKNAWLNDIKFLPGLLEQALLNLDEAQLDTPYRDGGWTVKEVTHHVADSHINAYCRFKLGLTENNPTIKTYEESLWAKLDDTRNLPVNISVTLLHALHLRWYEILRNLTREEWNRTIRHPQYETNTTLYELLGRYAWHGLHHVAHITSLRERMGW